MSAPTKDLCTIILNESVNLPVVKQRVLNAFLEGYMCFLFRLRIRGRLFEDRVALPADADEACALEMAEFQFARFCNTVGLIAVKRL